SRRSPRAGRLLRRAPRRRRRRAPPPGRFGMTEPAASERYACPRCGDAAERVALAARAYRCGACSLELAHVEVAPNGTVRSVIGWLRLSGETLLERYQITGVLGRGGFAVTYLVGDLRLKGKRRALK